MYLFANDGIGQVLSTPGTYDAMGEVRSPARKIEFPPEVITISPQRKAFILRKAGWIPVNIVVTVKDFLGGPFPGGHKLFAEFKAPDVASVTEVAALQGGVAMWSNIWLKPQGTVRFLAVSTGAPSILPEGIAFYKVSARAPLRFKLTQRSKEVEVSASSSEEALTKVGAKGSAGIEFKILKMGGELMEERERGTTTGREVSWKVILPTAIFDVTQI